MSNNPRWLEVLRGIEADFGPCSRGAKKAIQQRFREAAERREDVEGACRDLARFLVIAQNEDDLAALPNRLSQPGSGGRRPVARTWGTKDERAHADAIIDRIARFVNSQPEVLHARAALGIPLSGVTGPEARALLQSSGPSFDELRRVAESLPSSTPFSDLLFTPNDRESAALWLILTGETSLLSPITAVESLPGSVDTITVTALARVASPESVADAFRAAQKRILGHRKGRPVRPRTFKVLAFVDERAGAGRLSKTKWRELFKEWNKTSRKGDRFNAPREMRDVYLAGVEATVPSPSQRGASER
jgi:hypothetical protein